ncbi:MAG: DUF2512 family protein [Syntrophomonas sp.]
MKLKHLQAILYKFLIVLVALEIVLGLLTNLSFAQILSISATVTLLAYILGDVLILPISNNTMATLADFGLAWATIYLFNYIYRGVVISITDAFLAAAVLGIGEWVFHKYMATSVIHE